MADTVIEGTLTTSFHLRIDSRFICSPAAGVAYCVYIEGSSSDLEYRKLSGGSWSAAVALQTGTNMSVSVWYDKWTKDITTTKLLIASIDLVTNDVLFNAIDLSDDSLDTETQIFNGVSVVAGSKDSATVSIIRAVGGNIYCWANIDAGTEIVFARSEDNGATWTARSTGLYESSFDRLILIPGNDADTNDIYAVYYDESAGILTLKVYDNSANSWSESASILTGLRTTITDAVFPLDAVQRHSDGHIIAVVREKSNPSDFLVVDITNISTFSSLTSVKSGLNNWYHPRIFINQQNDHLYAAYLGDDDGGDTFFSLADLFYKISTNGGSSWGSQLAMNVDARDDLRALTLPNCVTADGGMFLPIWHNDDILDLLCNLDNAITFGTSDSSAVESVPATLMPVVMAPIPAQVVGY